MFFLRYVNRQHNITEQGLFDINPLFGFYIGLYIPNLL